MSSETIAVKKLAEQFEALLAAQLGVLPGWTIDRIRKERPELAWFLDWQASEFSTRVLTCRPTAEVRKDRAPDEEWDELTQEKALVAFADAVYCARANGRPVLMEQIVELARRHANSSGSHAPVTYSTLATWRSRDTQFERERKRFRDSLLAALEERYRQVIAKLIASEGELDKAEEGFCGIAVVAFGSETWNDFLQMVKQLHIRESKGPNALEYRMGYTVFLFSLSRLVKQTSGFVVEVGRSVVELLGHARNRLSKAIKRLPEGKEKENLVEAFLALDVLEQGLEPFLAPVASRLPSGRTSPAGGEAGKGEKK